MSSSTFNRKIKNICGIAPLIVMLGCTVGSDGPPSANSQAANALSTLEGVSNQAVRVNEAALSLESLIDEGRRRIAQGESKEMVLNDIKESLAAVEKQNAALQAALKTFEKNLKASDQQESTHE